MAESGNGREREPQSLAEAVLETTVDGIISIDERGVVLSFNRAAAAMFAYARDEVIGQNVSILMGEPEHSEHDSYLSRYESTGEARIIGIGREVEGRRKDGSTFPLDLAVSEAVDSNGSRIYVGILRDLTEHREARRAIRASESQYESLVRSAPIGIAISDEGRWIFEANDALA